MRFTNISINSLRFKKNSNKRVLQFLSPGDQFLLDFEIFKPGYKITKSKILIAAKKHNICAKLALSYVKNKIKEYLQNKQNIDCVNAMEMKEIYEDILEIGKRYERYFNK